jgi:leucyl aminopeptidase
LAERIRGSEVVLCDVGATLSRESFRAFCEGLLLASHRFTRKSGDHQPKPLLVQLAVPSVASAQPTLDRALATARAVCLARDLGNRPSNSKSPAWVAVEAKRVGKESGFRVRVIDQAGLERGGFGGLTAVGAGSANPPQLVIMDYKGGAGGPHVVLVGKGITFDSGGLCLKPADGMPLMKTDMAGAAAVLAVMSALRDLDVGVDVTGVLACAENMPGASAYRPSDVVRHFGGRTSEVVDTDAEGRLVLADALAYAAARLAPDVVIDIATLTGAATMALSRSMGALYTQDDGLAVALQAAGVASNDRLWRMPLVGDYRSALDSSVADISHVARTDVGAGSITAALFLQEFVAGVRWAHLDIAGPGRAEAPRAELARGATGFGARVLLRWLEGAPDLW